MKILIEAPALTQAQKDDRTLGRSLFVAGGTLDQCTNAAQRAGFVGAEADDRRMRFSDAAGRFQYDAMQPWQIAALTAPAQLPLDFDCPF